MGIMCLVGWHKLLTIKTVSLLEYMALALGETIKDMPTQDLFVLMKGIVEQFPNDEQHKYFETNFLVVADLHTVFAGNEAMQKHVKRFQDVLKEYQEFSSRYNLEQLLKQSHPDYEKDKNRVLFLKDVLLYIKLGLRIKFCTSCHQTFDVRETIGVYLPKIKSSLCRIDMNEKSGAFLLPNT